MSTPTALNKYQVTWLSGAGDRASVHFHSVQAASWEISPGAGFTYFRDADGTSIFTICTALLVSIEFITEKD